MESMFSTVEQGKKKKSNVKLWIYFPDTREATLKSGGLPNFTTKVDGEKASIGNNIKGKLIKIKKELTEYDGKPKEQVKMFMEGPEGLVCISSNYHAPMRRILNKIASVDQAKEIEITLFNFPPKDGGKRTVSSTVIVDGVKIEDTFLDFDTEVANGGVIQETLRDGTTNSYYSDPKDPTNPNHYDNKLFAKLASVAMSESTIPLEVEVEDEEIKEDDDVLPPELDKEFE